MWFLDAQVSSIESRSTMTGPAPSKYCCIYPCNPLYFYCCINIICDNTCQTSCHFKKAQTSAPQIPKPVWRNNNPSSSLTCFWMRNKLRVKYAQFWFANITFHKNDLPRTHNWCPKRIPTIIIIRLRIIKDNRKEGIWGRVKAIVTIADYNKHLRSGWNQQDVMCFLIFCLAEQP